LKQRLNLNRKVYLQNQACGPSPFPQAKADALSMAKGAIGDCFVIDPIRHLNELQSRVANEAAA